MGIVRAKIKRLDILGGVGAFVLGAGLGTLLEQWFPTYALAAVLIGIAAHGFAMFQKHRVERDERTSEPRWVVAAYWLCWVMLAILTLLLAWTWVP